MPKAQPLKRDIQNTDMQLFCEYIMGYYAEAQYHFGEAQKEIGIADVILVPYMHHLYMGTLQALGYRLLAHTRATKTLFLFLPGVNDTNECVVPDATVVKHIL